MSVEAMIDSLIVNREHGYTDDPQDKGGKTRWGVTEVEARRTGYAGDMKDFPLSAAREIYRREYWVKPNLYILSVHFPLLAEKLFDIAVNCGVNIAGMFLQRCLNALNDQGKDYPDLQVDGVIGISTIKALDSYLAKRGGTGGRRTLLFMVAAQQSCHYVNIASTTPSNEKFEYGWQVQRALYLITSGDQV
jgi:lysozyme family protein